MGNCGAVGTGGGAGDTIGVRSGELAVAAAGAWRAGAVGAEQADQGSLHPNGNLRQCGPVFTRGSYKLSKCCGKNGVPTMTAGTLEYGESADQIHRWHQKMQSQAWLLGGACVGPAGPAGGRIVRR